MAYLLMTHLIVHYNMYFNIENSRDCQVPIIPRLSTMNEQPGSLSFSALVVLLMYGVSTV